MKKWWMKYCEETDGEGSDLGGDGGADAGAGDGGGDSGDGGSAVQGDWPGDWRSKLSPDGKHAKTLDRFASPNALFDSYQALRQRLDSGEFKQVVPFPDKGTPEEQNAWRKSNNIPEKPDEYSLKFDDGLVVGDADKPIVDDFLKAAHEANASPEQVNKMLHWYYDLQERNATAQEESDANYLRESEDALRAEWGGEFRPNINMIKGLLATIPESARDAFANARDGEGKALLNHPDFARWLVQTARTLNPAATVVPNAGANVAGAIDDEIAAIEKTMRTDRKTYNNDQKMQQRLRDLYDARQRASH